MQEKGAKIGEFDAKERFQGSSGVLGDPATKDGDRDPSGDDWKGQK